MAEQEQQSTSLTQPVRSRANLKQLLELNKESIAAVIPAYLTPEKMLKVVMLSAMANPDLFECTKESILKAVMVSANTGIPIGPQSGHLVPFNKKVKAKNNVPEHWVKEAQFIPDYRGLIGQAKRCNAITKAEAHLVYQDDEFEIDWGNEAKPLTHKPNYLSKKRAAENVIAAYFRAKLPDGDYQYEVMTKDELDAIKTRSKASNSGPWVTDPGQMYRKTVTKRGMNYIPTLDDRTIAAIQHDNAVDAGENIDVVGLLQDISSETAPQMIEPSQNNQPVTEQEARDEETRSKLDTVAEKVAAAKARAQENKLDTSAEEKVEEKKVDASAAAVSKPEVAPVPAKTGTATAKKEKPSEQPKAKPKPWEKKQQPSDLEEKVQQMAAEKTVVAETKVESQPIKKKRVTPTNAALNNIAFPEFVDATGSDDKITEEQKINLCDLMDEFLTVSAADTLGQPPEKWLNDTVTAWIGIPIDEVNQETAVVLEKILTFRIQRVKNK